MSYDPRSFWQSRLAENFSLRGVGHLQFDERYNEWLYRAKKRRFDQIWRGESLAGKRVLDIGCGTGAFVGWYLERGAQVHGLDITDVSIQRLATRFPQATFACCDIGDPSFVPPGQFDIVNMWDVMYHITDPERFRTALANIAASCAPFGRFVFTDRLGAPADLQVAQHVVFRCRATYDRELPPLGFDFRSARPLYHWLNNWYERLGWRNNQLAPLWYRLDGWKWRLPKANLSVGVWQKRAA